MELSIWDNTLHHLSEATSEELVILLFLNLGGIACLTIVSHRVATSTYLDETARALYGGGGYSCFWMWSSQRCVHLLQIPFGGWLRIPFGGSLRLGALRDCHDRGLSDLLLDVINKSTVRSQAVTELILLPADMDLEHPGR